MEASDPTTEGNGFGTKRTSCGAATSDFRVSGSRLGIIDALVSTTTEEGVVFFGCSLLRSSILACAAIPRI
eukprot:7516983-Ditylum_brightwellii.AAC.1